MINFVKSKGYAIVSRWFADLNNEPFEFQKQAWHKFSQGHSGLVIAPTGYGKTFSVFLAIIIDFLNRPESYRPGLKILWITPLRSLATDLSRTMTDALQQIGLDWEVGVRNGDTSPKERARQRKQMPEVLVTTPESLHLIFAGKNHDMLFSSLRCVAVDEWHELLGSKRGVMVELAIPRLRNMAPHLCVWGISATIGNIEEALEVLTPGISKRTLIRAKVKKKIRILPIIPDKIETLPWAGHLGLKMAKRLIPIIDSSRTTLIFTNTRGQAELWYQTMLEAHPDLAGQLAIHHGSIDWALRIWIEEMLHQERLKVVICTSSLDLGVDFKPVDTVVQIGSPKGVARFLQRAGRSGHSPFETSVIYFLPTHSLELVEAAALKEAAQNNEIESREPQIRAFDVLIQYLVTLAVGDGFDPEEIYKEVLTTHAFQSVSPGEWQQLLTFITRGGEVLEAYREFHRVVWEDGKYRVVSRKIATLHRLNIGVIVSEAMLKVRWMSGGYVGMVEEYFVSRMKSGDNFILAGRTLEFVMIKDMTVLVRKGYAKKAVSSSWLGGRMPLSSNLSSILRKKYSEVLNIDTRDPALLKLRPLFQRQQEVSHVPRDDEFLVETIDTDDGYHLFMYPFEGRLVHEVMAALVAFRLSLRRPLSISMAMNDYGFELLSEQPFHLNEGYIYELLSEKNLVNDIALSINSTELAARKFRDIAVISGMVIRNYLGEQKNDKNLQASAGLIFRVLSQYDPDNLLVKQAHEEVFFYQLEEPRLAAALRRIQRSKVVLTHAKAFSPLSFPIKVDSLRQNMSNEALEQRIRRMQAQALMTNE